MNTDRIAGNWTQLKGEAKILWGKPIGDDHDIAEGHRDRLAGLIQERHGRARDAAERTVDAVFARF